MFSQENKSSGLQNKEISKSVQLSCLMLASAVGVLGVVQEAEAGTVLKKGSAGDQVQKLQEKLQNLGYLDTNPTGYFGVETEKALRKFQQAKGLAADGMAGKATMSVLFGNLRELNVGASNSTLPPSNGPLPVPANPPLGNIPSNMGLKVASLASNNQVKPVNNNSNNMVAVSNNNAPLNQVVNSGNRKKSYLYSSQMFRRGDRHQGIVLLQQELQKRGFYRGTIDGIYGSDTERAVRSFQRANNLSTDGVVGMNTLAYFAR